MSSCFKSDVIKKSLKYKIFLFTFKVYLPQTKIRTLVLRGTLMKHFLLAVFLFAPLMGMQPELAYHDIQFDENMKGAVVLQACRSDHAYIYILKRIGDGELIGYQKPSPLSGYEKLPQEEAQRLHAELLELFKRKQLMAKY